MANGAMDDDAEQFSLRWNNFHNNITCGFHELLEEKDLVDVTLACDGQYVQAHKLVLTVCSPYFKALFKINPHSHPIVILKDVHFSDLQAILQFMYRGEVNVRQEDLTNFLKTAEVLKIKGLTGDEKNSGSTRQTTTSDSTTKTVPHERPSSPPSAPAPKRKRTQEPQSSLIQTPVSHVRSPSPSARQAQASPMTTHAATDQSDVEYVDVSETKVEPDDYIDDEQYSRDDLNDDDLSLSASDPLSSSSQMLGPPPLHAGPSTSRDSAGKEALQGMASFAGIAGPSSQHDAGVPGAQELTSQGGLGHFMLDFDVQQYYCEKCNKGYSSRTKLQRHYDAIHGIHSKPVLCELCNVTFKNRDSLRSHTKRFHSNSAPKKTQ